MPYLSSNNPPRNWHVRRTFSGRLATEDDSADLDGDGDAALVKEGSDCVLGEDDDADDDDDQRNALPVMRRKREEKRLAKEKNCSSK